MLVGLFTMLGEITSTPEDSFLLGMFVVIAFVIVSVPVGIAPADGPDHGNTGASNAPTVRVSQALATWGIVLNVPLCWCVLFLPLVVLAAIS